VANEDHLRVLQQGVDAWNQWRTEHPDIWPDLWDTFLNWADLRGADLRGARFMRADLCGADFSGAHLMGADLSGAHLNWARFMRADLRGADLMRADLSGADLTEADLRGADLSGADLNAADLTWARVGGTIFGAVNLSVAKGLESVIHHGPSTIGIDTVHASQGRIPEVFLRGAGIPDEFITYMRSLVGRAIEFYSCFISYSRAIQAKTRTLPNDSMQTCRPGACGAGLRRRTSRVGASSMSRSSKPSGTTTGCCSYCPRTA
jgi:hypothetical protein